MNYADKNIVFYDGDCAFCNRSVQFILRWERKPVIYFAALQSDFAKEFFAANNCPEPDLSTFYFYSNYFLYSKSSAAFALLYFLKFPLKIAYIFKLIPICYRDRLYDAIAKRRQKLAKNFCVVPNKDQINRFLSAAENK